MKTLTDITTFREYGSVATIGFFDGVHLGHRFLLNELKETAVRKNRKTLVITFDNHPRATLQNGYLPLLLTTNEEKISLLDNAGIDACLMLPFTEEMASCTASAFFETILHKQLQIDTLLTGYDHRFGKNRTESLDDYLQYGKRWGIQVETAGFYSEKENRLSSSYIRELLQQGDVAKANHLLGYRYGIQGEVVKGLNIGKRIGFPTANLSLLDNRKLLPARGVYAVSVSVKGKSYKGMLNIGYRPTIGNSDEKNVEVHILNFNENIYSERVEVFFVDKIREEKHFKTIEELILQLEKDRDFLETKSV